MISFVRVDDHDSWSDSLVGYRVPCDGIIAVNDAAASSPVLKSAYKSAAPDKKGFVWTFDHFKEALRRFLTAILVIFLLLKTQLTVKKILVDFGLKPGLYRCIIGPGNDRPGADKAGQPVQLLKKRDRH